MLINAGSSWIDETQNFLVIGLFLRLISITQVAAVQCQNCTGDNVDCNSGVCEGKWCYVEFSYRTDDKSFATRKECVDFNAAKLLLKNDRDICGMPRASMVAFKRQTSLLSSYLFGCACQEENCNDAAYLKKASSKYATFHSDYLTRINLEKLIIGAPSQRKDDVGISCYACESEGEDCISGSCRGKWCLTHIIKELGNTYIVKNCSQINLAATDEDACISLKNLHQLSNAEGALCSCSSEDNCNSLEYADRLYAAAHEGEMLFGNTVAPDSNGLLLSTTTISAVTSSSTRLVSTAARNLTADKNTRFTGTGRFAQPDQNEHKGPFSADRNKRVLLPAVGNANKLYDSLPPTSGSITVIASQDYWNFLIIFLFSIIQLKM